MSSAFLLRVRVYWEDTDAGGVVFHANILRFFERARTEWLRTLGFSQQQLAAEHAVMFVVTDAQLGWRAPARLDDELDITVSVERTSPVTITLGQQAWRGKTLIADGSVRIACVDAQALAPRRVPDAIASAVDAFSASGAQPPSRNQASVKQPAVNHPAEMPAA